MFKLQLYDHHGNALKLGDIVRINSGDRSLHEFYARLTWLKEEQAIAPFHTFTFHSMEKVEKVPESATKSTEPRYDIWYIEKPDGDPDRFEDYLMSWRECEHQIQKRAFRIIPESQLDLFV